MLVTQDIQIDTSAELAAPRRRPFFVGVSVSVGFHVLLVLAILIVPQVLWLWFNLPTSFDPNSITVVSTIDPNEDARVDEPPPPVPVRIVTHVDEVTGDMVLDKQLQVIAESNKKSVEENRNELDKMARKLDEVSSAESLNVLAESMHKWLRTEKRATKPAENPQGHFDHPTAQMHDIRREPLESGGWRYVCILIDAEGRTFETEVDPESGRQLYDTMEKMKAFPLLEQVYRQMVMPLMDKAMSQPLGASQPRSAPPESDDFEGEESPIGDSGAPQ